jgi:H/ACA ribonucleoprotein complex subunit 3
MRRCRRCGEYTLNQEHCPKCGGAVYIPHPAKFSIDDRYAKYRRALKREAGSETAS